MRFLEGGDAATRYLQRLLLALESLQLLAQLFHLIVLLADSIAVRLVLGYQILQLALLIAQLQVGVHALLQRLLNLLLHLNFLKFLGFDSVL